MFSRPLTAPRRAAWWAFGRGGRGTRLARALFDATAVVLTPAALRGAPRVVSALCLGALPAPALLTEALAPGQAAAQPAAAQPPALHVVTGLDRLVTHAVAVNPAVRAARARIEAARARITPAGLLPDPTLMAGVQNFPVSEPGFRDFMTMKMVGVGQTLPYPGKLALRRQAAAREAEAADAALAATTLQVVRDVRGAYYELAFLDRAMEVVTRTQRVLGDLIRVAETRYGVGDAGQPGAGLQDVLRARVEATRLAEQAVALTEQRRAALARLNAALDRPSETPVAAPQIPGRVTRAAVADSARRVRFVSAALGARAADSPLPPLVAVQDAAVRESPVLRAQEATIAAQAARVELARRDYLPDVDVSLQYGQRQGYPDMVTATVSVPLPLQRRRRQDQLVAAARADLAELEATRQARRNDLRAEVARLYAELERQRAQLALYVKALLPQGRASLTAATASYQVGRAEFLTVLENQATLFTYETEYFRTLADFATTAAELERVVGREVF